MGRKMAGQGRATSGGNTQKGASCQTPKLTFCRWRQITEESPGLRELSATRPTVTRWPEQAIQHRGDVSASAVNPQLQGYCNEGRLSIAGDPATRSARGIGRILKYYAFLLDPTSERKFHGFSVSHSQLDGDPPPRFLNA